MTPGIVINGQYQKKLDDLLVACRKNLRSLDEDLISRAFAMSLEAHKHDLRASGEPYFLHPYEVALVVAKEIALDDVSVASALLHDVVEDTRFELKDIRAEFGDAIADIVDGATKITDIFESHEVTQAESYRKLLLSMVNDIRVMLIKFADRLHNMRTLEYLPPDKQQRMARETLEIYAPFAHRFGLAKIKWELEDLSFKYLDRKEYDLIARQIKVTRKEREHYINKFVQPIKKRLEREAIAYEIEGRPKHIYSVHNKMLKRAKPLEEIYDLFAVRIILDTEDNNDCFLVYGVVSELYKPIPERFKDYISVPKKNGYQSIHTTVVGPEGRLVEVQIRTRQMHAVAERGVAAHWLYKEGTALLSKELEGWINWVREIFEQKTDDAPRELMESFKLNLYQDEIYVFTPKGDLKILPRNSTPIDFAFEIHSNVGVHCIGAKVNGRIVPLNTILRSGDQVEIITSKSQNPNPDWEQFVVTHKAKSSIRRWIREESRKKADSGKELFEKKLKRAKLHYSEDDLTKFVHQMRFDNLHDFYAAVGEGKVDADAVVEQLELRAKHPTQEFKGTPEETQTLFTKFLSSAREMATGITIFGSHENLMHQYAKCCNPIPGDEIVGFVTTGEGIKIHRKDCKNIISLRLVESARLVDVNWPPSSGADFIVAVHVSGKDRPGLLSDVTHAISTFQNTNIRSVNMDSKGPIFDGQIILFVKDTEHLARIIEKIKKVPGIIEVDRFVG
ncbi:MAG: RelA/SpoT family protein [Ignavibacteria bacterium GWA2_55_11]|nr:MAG: RelA/SpoT family protein [Ignavibacteria bacterium GWA2_55_11]OGU44436.1 MAG: RelA/SpoT family protein [Ignavibacteria bacterium GWC2_56_12]OGU68300.1 MAG: RelA/SpoT family protein [Ignavibacteria bacterium RIFCSPHIGHO2_02_FULL_56_12]OGU72209.1 MAG: RelA/SpoT family protein [Ignavibacteria bacterium RIFCSPLOWO2_02_FULL_55_14]OGU72277.1 MAG: RelA/SpoT family protein [Ignavibacteria bacterium RIFCSPLOWO2_12_FULL_56_21]HAV22357.1 RelA/SpoT family protein [Bacteroidota bacterium]